MDWATAVPLGSLIISVVTIVFAIVSMRSKAESAYVERIDERLSRAEDALQKCEEDRIQLRQEIIRLLEHQKTLLEKNRTHTRH